MSGKIGPFFVPGGMIPSFHEEGARAMPWFGQGFYRNLPQGDETSRHPVLNRLEFYAAAR
jgi:hypothetical protein